MTKVATRTGTTGPIHDPYGYEIVYITRPDGTYIEYLSCGLRGEVLTVDGEDVASIPSYKETDEQRAKFNEAFEKAVGCSYRAFNRATERLEARKDLNEYYIAVSRYM